MAFTPIQYIASRLGYVRGKDVYTQTPVFTQSQIFNGKTPLWVSVDDKEAEVFNTTPELYSVIMKKATMYSNGIFKHYKTVNGKVVEVENSEYLKLLEKPNVLQGRNEWMMDELIQTSVYGCSFGYKLQGYRGASPSALYNLPANRMKIIPTGKIYQQSKLEDIIKEYQLTDYSGAVETFETNQVLYSRIQNPENPILGKSPLHALQMPISNIRGAYGYRNVLINERGAIGMISNDSKDSEGGVPLKNAEREKIERQFTNDYGIGAKQNKVLISSSNLKWTPFSYPTKDLMLFEEISNNLNAIIDTYGMKSELFSKEKGSTFANLLEAKRSVYQDTIIPYAEDFTYKLTSFLGLDVKGEWIALDYSHVEALQQNNKAIAETNKLKADAYNSLLSSGNFNDKELREMLGLTL